MRGLLQNTRKKLQIRQAETRMTYREFIKLPPAEQIRVERIAIMVIDGGLREEEAVEILENKQGELWK